jgi:hypothetical protein
MRGRFGSSDGGFDVWDSYGHVNDFTGPGDCYPFDLSHWEVVGGRINKPYTGFFASWFDNYRADVWDTTNINHLTLADAPGDVACATEAVARTNPSKALVDVAGNVLELGGLTQTIRDEGFQAIKRLSKLKFPKNLHQLRQTAQLGGEVNLLYNFGIAPIVGDLVKTLEFQDQLSRRVKALKKLNSKNGYRRTIDIGSYSANVDYPEVFQSVDEFIVHQMHIITRQQIRAHVRWILDTPDGKLIPDAEMVALATKAMYTSSLDAISLWEAFPWSWLIDWAYDVGTYFKASRNVVPAYLDGVHIIRHTRTEYSWSDYRSGNTVLSAGTVKGERKERNPSFVFPTAHLPLLSGYQMGILASLAVAKV